MPGRKVTGKPKAELLRRMRKAAYMRADDLTERPYATMKPDELPWRRRPGKIQKRQESCVMRRNENWKKKLAVILGISVMAALTGCQGAFGKEVPAQTEADGEAAGTERQSKIQAETDMQEEYTGAADRGQDGEMDGGMGTQDSESDADLPDNEADAEDNREDGFATPEKAKKQPPEGWELTLASEDWGLSFGEPGAQSVGNASAEDLAWYDAYYVGDDDEKIIYLTFDCGYENGNTGPILDALKKHNVQATFFVVGHFLETAPDLVRRMAEEGHAVGNHTYHHLDMPTISDQATFQKEMDDVADLFQEITGKELSPYYRPPQGKCNVANLKMAQELGYNTIFWSLAYVDWNQDDQPSHEEAFDKLTTRVHPGAVVLLHNTSQTNGEILDELLTKWEGMGYSFRPLAELVS